MRQTLLLSLGFFLMSFFALAEDDYKNSPEFHQLNQKVSEAETKKEKVDHLIELATFVRQFDLDESEKTAQKALKESKSANYSKGKALSYNALAAISNMRGDYEQAIKNCFSALKYAKSAGEKHLVATLNRNIGMSYNSSLEPELAMKYYKNALSDYLVLKDSLGVASCYNSMGSVYLSGKLIDLVEARGYFEKANKIANKLNHPPLIAMSSMNLALTLDVKKNPEKVLEWYLSADEALEQLQDLRNRVTSLFNIGAVYMELGQYEKSAEKLNECIQLCKITGQEHDQQTAHDLLRYVYIYQKNFELAYHHLYISDSLKLKVFNAEQDRNIRELDKLYQSEKQANNIAKKQKKILRLKKNAEIKNRTIWSLSVGGISAVIILVISLFLYSARKRAKEAQLQLSLEQYEHQIDVLKESIKSRTEVVESQPTPIKFELNVINSELKNQLSDREVEVVSELIKGKTNKEIAETLSVSINTVKTHLLNIYGKLDVKNRTQAVNTVVSMKNSG